MLNILLSGVGGQGSVLAARLLAQAAQNKGWQVRTAETIGMAQRGGTVVSHVRMGNEGEEVFSPLIARSTANLIIAFEPAEAARALLYLAPDGVVVVATSAIQSVSSALSSHPYKANDALTCIQQALDDTPARVLVVNDGALLQRLGTRKVLNTVLLASALINDYVPLTLDDLRDAVRVGVKERFVKLNLAAIDAVEQSVC